MATSVCSRYKFDIVVFVRDFGRLVMVTGVCSRYKFDIVAFVRDFGRLVMKLSLNLLKVCTE